MKALKLSSVLQQRMAMPLYSLSLPSLAAPERFGIADRFGIKAGVIGWPYMGLFKARRNWMLFNRFSHRGPLLAVLPVLSPAIFANLFLRSDGTRRYKINVNVNALYTLNPFFKGKN
ncbi:hypothetical protein [Paracoccus actinidiae]|uniref:hypothetical protein n=1 Tax=Paracoccus actinidiae TaxID=3064531 RepID=UPI0027D255D7|nr:hypothetical protein [Paracoccus sp. M09]